MLASRQPSPATARCNLYKVQSVAILSAPTKGIANFFLPFLNCVVSPSTRSLRSCRSLIGVHHRRSSVPFSFRRITFYFYFCSFSIFYFYSAPLFPPSNISNLELGGTPIRPRAHTHAHLPLLPTDSRAHYARRYEGVKRVSRLELRARINCQIPSPSESFTIVR